MRVNLRECRVSLRLAPKIAEDRRATRPTLSVAAPESRSGDAINRVPISTIALKGYFSNQPAYWPNVLKNEPPD
jgi:hypothetical protein